MYICSAVNQHLKASILMYLHTRSFYTVSYKMYLKQTTHQEHKLYYEMNELCQVYVQTVVLAR